MFIEFPKYVDYKYFYRFLLKDILRHANHGQDNSLIIALHMTEHIAPDVICLLLSAIKYIKSNNSKADIYLAFGSSTKLRAYLEDAWFFFYADFGYLFSTDLIEINRPNSCYGKSINTNKINRISIPLNSALQVEKHLPLEIVDQIQKQVFALFTSQKAAGMNSFGIRNPEQMATAFKEIVENSYMHCNNDHDYGCFYTFQNYRRSGLNFACSDVGIGFYKSLLKKFGNNDDTSHRAPKLFSLEEFRSFEHDRKTRNLAAILESIIYRIGESENVDYGFPYVFRTLIMPNNGILIIHSENTLVKVDREFIYRYFLVENDKIKDYRREEMRNLAMNSSNQQTEIVNGNVRIFGYSFPGVHMSVQIGG